MAPNKDDVPESLQERVPQSPPLTAKGFFANRHRPYLAAQLIFAATAFTFFAVWVFNSWLPPPGVAVALVGVVAATMSIHAEMGNYHKALWMLIIGAFLVIEIFAIKHAETEQAAKQEAALT